MARSPRRGLATDDKSHRRCYRRLALINTCFVIHFLQCKAIVNGEDSKICQQCLRTFFLYLRRVALRVAASATFSSARAALTGKTVSGAV